MIYGIFAPLNPAMAFQSSPAENKQKTK